MISFECSDAAIAQQLADAGAITLKARSEDNYAWLDVNKQIVAMATHQLLCVVGTTYRDGERVRFFRETPTSPMEIPATVALGWERARQYQPERAPDAAFILAKIDPATTAFYAMSPIRWGAPPEPRKADRSELSTRASGLVQDFAICARDMGSMQGQAEHIARVQQFQRDFEQFLADFPDQSIGTFAGYLGQRGVPHATALADIVTITNLYR